VLVEKRMNWRSVAGRGRPIGRRKDIKGAVAAIVGVFDGWATHVMDGVSELNQSVNQSIN
jgi:hypothetical protein